MPVLDTFMRAAPHVFRDVAAVERTAVEIRITGDAGGVWFLTRGGRGWELLSGCDAEPAASIAIPQDAAWRLFTRGLPGDEAKRLATVIGDPALCEPFFRTVAVIA